MGVALVIASDMITRVMLYLKASQDVPITFQFSYINAKFARQRSW